MLQSVRLGDARKLSVALPRSLEGVVENPLYARAREDPALNGHLSRGADEQAATHARVLTLRVLPDKHHIYVFWPLTGKTGGDPAKPAYRPVVDVLVESLANGKDKAPYSQVVRHAWVPYRAEVDGIVLRKHFERVLWHHPPGAVVVIRSPGEIRPLHLAAGQLQGAREDRTAFPDHLRADSVPGNDGYAPGRGLRVSHRRCAVTPAPPPRGPAVRG